MATAYIALGSNLGEPITQVRQAAREIDALENVNLRTQSSLYQTAPVGYSEAEKAKVPDFINAVVAVETKLTPDALITAILDIEDQAGRIRPYENAPRVLDCDLLLYDDVQLDTARLTLPHPRMHLRGFVLLPLFEIAPTLSLPNHGKIATLITPLIADGVQQLSLK